MHEDAELVVVDKPAGLVVHHGAGHRGARWSTGCWRASPIWSAWPKTEWAIPDGPASCTDWTRARRGSWWSPARPAPTASLSKQFRAHSAGREYLALVAGSMDADEGTIDAPIGRSTRQRTRMAVTTRGRQARTGYRVVTRFSDPVQCTLLEARLDTGRTHQVRVHLAAIGHPVIGDERYGGAVARPRVDHGPDADRGGCSSTPSACRSITPAGGRRTWDSPLPDDLAGVLAGLSS